MKCFSIYTVREKLILLAFLSFAIISLTAAAAAQGYNDTGNGGRNSIQGRLFLPSGQRISVATIRVRLESAANGDLTVYADTNGSFGFRNLNPGSYYIIIRDLDQFEDIREPAYIDDPGSSSVGLGIRLSSTPTIVNLPIYLMPKRSSESSTPPGVVDAELGKAPDDAADLFRKAEKLANSGNNQKAVVALVQAIEIFPQFSLAYNELGMLYNALGDRAKALDAFRNAVKYSPEALTPRLNFGCALVEMKNLEEAAQNLNVAIKLDKNSIQAFFCMGKAQVQMQNLEYAERALNRTLELSSGNHSRAHLLLGGVYWGEKKYRQAADELEKYLKLEPNAKDADQTRKTIADLRSRQN